LVQTLVALRVRTGGTVFKGETLRLSCVGGGPGSDIIGTLKYLADYPDEPVKKMTCYLLDGEQAWADTWTEIGQSLGSGVAFNLSFQRLDVCDPDSWSAQKKFLKADMFTLSYFVSEVRSRDDGKIGAFWKKLFDGAGSGATFVYVDNGHDSFKSYFDTQWKDRDDLECLISEDNIWKTPRYSEQAAELAEYREKFEQSPKLKALISYRVLRKR
jgi:hypothetical protein